MRNLCVVALFLSITNVINGQVKSATFKLNDTAFTVGSIYISPCGINFSMDGHSCLADEASKLCIDTFAQFMLNHPGVLIEIGAHTDQRGSDTFNTKLSQERAFEVKKYLESKGVPYYNMAAVGYGERKPLFSQAEINKMPAKEEKEKAYQSNRRIEFKLLNDPNLLFTLEDSVLVPGQIFRPLIFFDLGKHRIRPDCDSILTAMANFLIAHPECSVEVGGHTDTRVSQNSSMKLSQRRAEAVRAYLITKGVPESQLIAKGFEDHRLIVSDAEVNAAPGKSGQEELHQINRRVELRILSAG